MQSPQRGQHTPSLMRRVVEMVAKRNKSGETVVVPDREEDISLTPDGGVSTRVVKHERYFDCGCSTEVSQRGGKCIVCGSISCVAHHVACARCGAPVCRKHSRICQLMTGESSLCCEGCERRMVRTERMKRAGRTGLGLFIEHDSSEQS